MLDPSEQSNARNKTLLFLITYLKSHQKRENLKDFRRRKSQRPNIRAQVCNFERIESREADIDRLSLDLDEEAEHQKHFYIFSRFRGNKEPGSKHVVVVNFFESREEGTDMSQYPALLKGRG
jgi:hypothetical protein